MAGAGFKTFNTGDVLTASDVNTYLMQQTVMVFASAAARTTALGANVSQGMISYLKDINEVQTYNGSAWVSSDDPNAIQNSIVTAKGDIVAASGNATPARLAVGSNGYTLVADSAATTGLNYGFPNTNPVINGGFDIWQRGTSIAPAAGNSYVADRWAYYSSVTGRTVSRQATGDTTNLPNIQYCMRVARDSGNTSTAGITIGQSFESINSIPYAGKAITLSFYARAGANFSSASSLLNVNLKTGTGTDQNLVSAGYTGSVTAIGTSATLTTTWQRFTYSATLASNLTELGIQFDYTPVGTAGANDYFEITGVQIDLGSTALPFRRSGGTIQGELAACQRYYWRNNADSSYTSFGMGFAGTTTAFYPNIVCPVPMRIAPTSVDSSTLAIAQGGGVTAVTGVTLQEADNMVVVVNATTSGMTANSVYKLLANNSTNAYIGFNAEL